jgi:hypothetical protein
MLAVDQAMERFQHPRQRFQQRDGDDCQQQAAECALVKISLLYRALTARFQAPLVAENLVDLRQDCEEQNPNQSK